MKKVKSGVDMIRLEAEAVTSLRYVPVDVLKRIAEYKGHVPDYTKSPLTDRFLPFCKAAADDLPEYVSPNTVSVFGLLLLATASLSLGFPQRIDQAHNSPAHEAVAPGWCQSALFGLSVPGYYFFDCVAGQLTQKPGTLPAINYIVRQSCSSMAIVFLVLGVLAVLELRTDTCLAVGTSLSLTVFYIVHWQRYVSGEATGLLESRSTSFAGFCLVPIVLAFGGGGMLRVVLATELWSSYCMKHVVFMAICYNAGCVILTYARSIFEGGPGEEGTTPAGTGILSPALPLVFTLLMAWTLFGSVTFAKIPMVLIIAVGLIAMKVTTKLIIAHMSVSPLKQTDVVFWTLLPLTSDAVLGFTRPIDWFLESYICSRTDYFDSLINDGHWTHLLIACFAGINCIRYNHGVLSEIALTSGKSVFGVVRVKGQRRISQKSELTSDKKGD